jgi:NAD(P)-dependent dehydrogenase (short-subunit alcohol dehydrogenase family)
MLAARGYAVAMIDLHGSKATTEAIGAEALDFTGDVSDELTIASFAQAIIDRWGRADVLVNNAGISFIAPAETVSAADFRKVLEINLVAPFLLAKAFGTLMLAQGSGAIVNVVSIAGLVGIGDRSAYNASKHGLIGLTRTLAAEWGGRGVRSNAVCPGWVKTEMDIADQAAGGYTDADIANRVPMSRFAKPEEIAQAICFLADPELSGFINGQTLAVDGGWTADGSWETLRLRKR